MVFRDSLQSLTPSSNNLVSKFSHMPQHYAAVIGLRCTMYMSEKNRRLLDILYSRCGHHKSLLD